MSIRVYNPTSEAAQVASVQLGRLSSLAGRTVGLLDNGKIRVYELLHHIEELLYAQHGVAQVLHFKKPDASRPVPPEILADMQQCDVMISAVGD